MPKDKPDHHDAELVLKLYDLRRETVMRQSRDRIIREFQPKVWEDVRSVASDFANPLSVAFRQVSSYWEMAYGMARWEIVHAEYIVENSGEGILLYVKMQPFLERFREEFSPRAFLNTEWVATRTEAGRRYVELFQARLAKLAAPAR